MGARQRNAWPVGLQENRVEFMDFLNAALERRLPPQTRKGSGAKLSPDVTAPQDKSVTIGEGWRESCRRSVMSASTVP